MSAREDAANVLGDGAAGPAVLLASTYGDIGAGGSGGGVFSIEGSHARQIDRISTMGLACDGKYLARVMRCRAQDRTLGEVAIYDGRGVRRYLRLEQAGAVHDVAFDGENLVVVSTWHNAARWFDTAGRLTREVRFAGPTDSWHLNCVTRRDDVWYATMFGPVGAFGGSSPAREGAGRIVELESGNEIVGGLTAPHTPRWFDGLWLVCNSARGELLAADERTGRIVRRLKCGDWTRGIARDDDFLYVGNSHRRNALDSFEHAEIVVVDRAKWTVAERIRLPLQEIYDLVFVPRSLHRGLLRGFDVNPPATSELRPNRLISELGVEEQRALWPSGDALPWGDFRCTIGGTLPATCTGGAVIDVPVRLTNRSESFFATSPPLPVYVSYKWIDPASGAFLTPARAYRSPLPRTVFAGEAVDMNVLVVVPATAGRALLRITAVQEGSAWFDDQDPENSLESIVEITPAPPTTWEPVVR